MVVTRKYFWFLYWCRCPRRRRQWSRPSRSRTRCQTRSSFDQRFPHFFPRRNNHFGQMKPISQVLFKLKTGSISIGWIGLFFTIGRIYGASTDIGWNASTAQDNGWRSDPQTNEFYLFLLPLLLPGEGSGLNLPHVSLPIVWRGTLGRPGLISASDHVHVNHPNAGVNNNAGLWSPQQPNPLPLFLFYCSAKLIRDLNIKYFLYWRFSFFSDTDFPYPI